MALGTEEPTLTEKVEVAFKDSVDALSGLTKSAAEFVGAATPTPSVLDSTYHTARDATISSVMAARHAVEQLFAASPPTHVHAHKVRGVMCAGR